MPRDLNGSSDYLTGSPGALVGLDAGPITMAAIIALDATSPGGAIVYCGGGTESGVSLEVYAGSYYLGSQEPALIAASAGDGWHLIAATKAAGTATPRVHKYVYSSNTHSHTNAGATMSDGVAVGSGHTLQVGRWGSASSRLDGRVAIAAVWDRVLSDAEVELLAFSLHCWYGSAPVAGWLLDEPTTTTKIADWTGGGANITGGAAGSSTASVPVFSYGHPIIVARTAPAAPIEVDGVLGLTATLAGDAAGDRPIDGTLTVTATLAADTVADRPISGTLTLQATTQATFTAELAAQGDLAVSCDRVGDASLQYLDNLWYGSQVYATIADRDRWHGRILDFVQATRGTVDWPVVDYGTGLTLYDEATVGEDTGPALYWALRVSAALINEAQELGQEAADAALSGTHGTGQIVD